MYLNIHVVKAKQNTFYRGPNSHPLIVLRDARIHIRKVYCNLMKIYKKC
jgi:hypothetical protein